MKNKKTLLVIGVAVLLVSVVGATFAFFNAQNATSQSIGAEVQTATGDTSTFLVNGDLSFTADDETFSESSGDKSTTVRGRVVFRAGTENASGSDLCYTVKVNMISNNFNYTNSSSYPELVLQARYIDETSNSLHTPGAGTVPYVTVPVAAANNETGYVGRNVAISGYDVTTNQNTFYIANKTFIDGNENVYKIHAAAGSTVKHDWMFKLNFINYEWDQADITNANNNNNKTFDGQIVFEQTTCPTETTPTYAYWNNNFSSYEYNSSSMPNDATKTAPEGRTYGSRELLVAAYDNAYTGTRPNNKHFSDRSYYIRTTLNNGVANGHEACLWYNNHEFCLGPNYWVETGDGVDNKHMSEANGLATKAKLQAAMEEALGTTADSCYSSASYARCYFGSLFCTAPSRGDAQCSVGGDDSSCFVEASGDAICFG